MIAMENKIRPVTKTIRRKELKSMVPLSDTTIYLMEKRGEFPLRFALTARCIVWDYYEVQEWLNDRKNIAAIAKHEMDERKQQKESRRVVGR